MATFFTAYLVTTKGRARYISDGPFCFQTVLPCEVGLTALSLT